MEKIILAFHTGFVYQLAHVQLSVLPHALELFIFSQDNAYVTPEEKKS